jgi:DnaJ-class molecular chaperone
MIDHDYDEPDICPTCNGGGEGQYDGTTCPACGGSGTDPICRNDHPINWEPENDED